MGVLDGKAGVVTGAGRGVGRGHALHLCRQGASIVVNDVDREEGEKVVAEIKKEGGRAIASDADIGTREGCDGLIKQCVDAFGSIDLLVNNAGNMRDKTLLNMSDEDFEAVLRVHATGTFRCTRAAALRMRDQGKGGAIVNTTSAAHMGNFGQTNYAGAKGAICSMTYTWALELARYGIRVNAISPMATTRMSQTFKGPDGKVVEMPFFDPALNGPMVVFLCSDHGAYVTGQVFGTGGDRIALLSQPRYGSTMFKPGGWQLEDILANFKQSLGNRLEPFGLQKAPYPFYDGVKPR